MWTPGRILSSAVLLLCLGALFMNAGTDSFGGTVVITAFVGFVTLMVFNN